MTQLSSKRSVKLRIYDHIIVIPRELRQHAKFPPPPTGFGGAGGGGGRDLKVKRFSSFLRKCEIRPQNK